jgi:RecA-family ATPase
MSEFDFDTKPEEIGWLINNLIPSGHLCLFLSQAGIGKSLLLECIATHLVFHKKFLGFDTAFGDVLLIDQDTPNNVITARLGRFGRGTGSDRFHKLYLESMKNYSLKDKTLSTIINDHPAVRLIGIDSFHSICNGSNPNSTADMSSLAALKAKCLTENRTIIINHHISEHVTTTIESLMTGDPHKLSMGNSAIVQQADTYYIIGAIAEKGITDKIYFRPVSKRASIPTKPIIIKVLKTSDGETMELEGYYDPEMDEPERDIMTLFKEHNVERTVKETYEAMGHQHGENLTRTALASLAKKGKLMLSRYKSNLFRYKLP